MQSKMMLWGGTAILGLSLVLAACNNDVKTPIDTGGTGTPPAIVGFKYVPADVTIKAGTSLKLPGDPGQPLTGETTETDSPLKTTTLTSPTDVKFDKVGTFTFHCTNHGVNGGSMKGTITVTN
jgi:plastocyanin